MTFLAIVFVVVCAVVIWNFNEEWFSHEAAVRREDEENW